jgi:hypothetical protein
VSEWIDIDRVDAVLLSDGWHHVRYHTFDVTSFGFSSVVDRRSQAATRVHDGGLGFTFTEQDSVTGDLRRVVGPISSVLAVKYNPESDGSVVELDEGVGHITTFGLH